MKFAEPMDDDAMNELLEEQGKLQDAIDRPAAGKSIASSRLPPMHCGCRPGTPR